MRLALDASMSFQYQSKEIIVVDDSTDRTIQILQEYAVRGCRIIRRSRPTDGCCGARNAGLRAATGDVVVFLNADVFPPPDFLDRLARHYRQGADYVICRGKVANTQRVIPRFIDAAAILADEQEGSIWHEWCEGFSCRRSIAMAVGGFPGEFPVPFCRDWLLGAKFRGRYRKVVDHGIVVLHKAPERFSDYWTQRRRRGEISAIMNCYFGVIRQRANRNGECFKRLFRKHSMPYLSGRMLLKHCWQLFLVFAVIPHLVHCLRCSRFSTRNGRDVFAFFVLSVLEVAAVVVGNWRGLAKVAAANLTQKKSDRANTPGGK